MKHLKDNVAEPIKMFDTLLKGLKDDDYESIISQEKLREKGYSLHFVIDADLIGHYCYPKGIIKEEINNQKRLKLTEDYIADEQVTLHSIFKLNKGLDRVVFFDEYTYEFEAMIYKATRFGEKQVFDLELPNFKITSDSEFKELLFNNFSKIIASVLLNIDGLRKASSLFKEKMLIFESVDFKNDFLEQVVNSNKGTDYCTDAIFKTWETAIRKELKLVKNKKRDSRIYDRVVSFNKHIQNKGNGDGQKHIFLLLTDSSLAKELFHFLLSFKTEIEYPKIDGKKINLIRSVPQTFAYLISLCYLDNKEVDHGGTIKNLQKLKDVSRKVEISIANTEKLLSQNDPKNENIDLFYSDEYGQIFDNYRQLRNAFENTGLLKSFDGLYDSVKNEIKILNLQDLDEIFKRIKKEFNSLSKELISEHLEYLHRLEEEATFTTTFVDNIELIKLSGGTFDLSKGEDYVEGSYQHLPIFLTFNFENSEFRNHMNRLMMLVLNRRMDESRKLYFELESLLDLMKYSRSNLAQQLEINLIKAFIFMIMPSTADIPDPKDISKGRRNDRIAYKWLLFLSKNNKISDKQLASDLLYLLCWVTRRIGEYKISLGYADNGIKKYPNDPRFFHGKFLTQYCILESKSFENKNLVDVDIMISLLMNARNHYLKFIKTNFHGFDTNLIIAKLIDTYHNNYCYCLTLKAYIKHYKSVKKDEIIVILDEARENLNKLKTKYKYRDELPEYYDTEAHLEYIESFYSRDKLMKVHRAKEAILKALALSNNNGLLEKYSTKLEKISTRIKELENV